MTDAKPAETAQAPPPVGAAELVGLAGLVAMFALAQATAILLLDPFKQSGLDQVYEDPGNAVNAVWLLLTVLVFTALILLVAKYKLYWIIRALILGSVGLTLVYVFYPLLDYVPGGQLQAPVVAGISASVLLSLVPATLLTWLLVKFPEWYIVDVIGLGVSAATIAIFGSSVTPLVAIIILVAFAVYDYVSVYRTKHMLTLADSVLDLHLPILLVVPKSLDYSFLEEKGRAREAADAAAGKRKPRDAMFIGLGDVVIPSILGVSALRFLDSWGAAIGTFAGIEVGLLILMYFVLRGRPHAGLPTLNTTAILGFLLGLGLETGSLRFW